MLVRVTSLDDRNLAWVATAHDERPLGQARLRLPEVGGVADLTLEVRPDQRRAGVGTRLLVAVAGAATRRGLTGILTEPVVEGSAGDLFCAARGLRRVLRLIYTRLDLAGPGEAGPGEAGPREAGPREAGPREAGPREAAVPGYRVAYWEGVVPQDLAESFARARHAMDDMPMDDAGYVPQPWDVPRLHRIAAAVEERGETLCTVAALDATGEIAGFTELVVPPSGDGQHYGTGVLPRHRGRGLARWMKAESIRRARERFPDLPGLLTDTADSNAAMRRVNETLGYRPTHRSVLYRLDVSGERSCRHAQADATTPIPVAAQCSRNGAARPPPV
jgi:GNAT superfamily N-acetyltransferase